MVIGLFLTPNVLLWCKLNQQGDLQKIFPCFMVFTIRPSSSSNPLLEFQHASGRSTFIWPFVRPTVCSICLLQQHVVGLLLWAQLPGVIDQLLHSLCRNSTGLQHGTQQQYQTVEMPAACQSIPAICRHTAANARM